MAYAGPYRTPQVPRPPTKDATLEELLRLLQQVQRVQQEYLELRDQARKRLAEAVPAPADTLAELWRLRRFIVVLKKWVSRPHGGDVGYKAAQDGVINLLHQLETKKI